MYTQSATIDELKRSTARLVQVVRPLPDRAASWRLQADKWSVIEIMEHICLIETGILHIWSGPTREIEREAALKVPHIRSTFQDDDTPLRAGAPIRPTGRFATLNETLDTFVTVRNQMADRLEAIDEQLEYTAFNHRIFGLLTSVEWAYFSIYHSDRHLRQIAEIRQARDQNGHTP